MSDEHADWCNCQAIPDTVNYPGPWHPRGDVTCQSIIDRLVAADADDVAEQLERLGWEAGR